MALLVNAGTCEPPRLRIYLNLGNLEGLPADSIWPDLHGPARHRRLADDGFEGVQLIDDADIPEEMPFPYCGLDRISTAPEADATIAKHRERGDICLTVHAGWGLEDDRTMFEIVESILNASEKYRIPVFIETHRATITQDLWRTVQITREFPEVRFNGDFSHYYTGQELVYGDWESKLAFMEPIFSRIGFLHGRIGSPGCIQVAIGDDTAARPFQAHGALNFLEHFKELWTRAMLGFLRAADEGDILIFAPELLPGLHYYARLFPNESGMLVEESDRYAQSLLYQDMARDCFLEAQRRLSLK